VLNVMDDVRFVKEKKGKKNHTCVSHTCPKMKRNGKLQCHAKTTKLNLLIKSFFAFSAICFLNWRIVERQSNVGGNCEFSDAKTCKFELCQHSNITRRKGLKILIHYIYYETEDMLVPVKINKRVNLLTFIKGAVESRTRVVDFFFTLSGSFPTVRDFYDSVGVQTSAQEVFPNYPNVKVFGAPSNKNKVSDLCHHAKFIRSQHEEVKNYDYFIFTNDGVRGPFYNKKDETDMSDTSLPYWLSKFVNPFVDSKNLCMVGPAMSCEIRFHLQSWWLTLSNFYFSDYLAITEETCESYMPWSEAIKRELRLSENCLKKGGAIASYHPMIYNFTKNDEDVLNNDTSSCMELFSHCRNPTITFEASVEALQSQVFIKYGGEPWRRKQYSNAQVGIIERETRDILGEYAEYSNSDRPALHF